LGTTAPRPQTVGDHRTTARMVSMAWLEMLGHDQPRDSHVRGGPHARAEPTAPLGPHPRGVCARRTATKYRNTTTATRHPERLGAALACSTVNMVAVARSSGRRGRRFKSCHPDQCSRRPEAPTGLGEGLSCCQYSSKRNAEGTGNKRSCSRWPPVGGWLIALANYPTEPVIYIR